MHYEAGEADYRRAAIERFVYKSEMFAGSVYLAGCAVESMLRAVIWKHDHEIKSGRKSLETGHDLRKPLTGVAKLGIVMRPDHRDELEENIQRVGRLWFNNMRFVPTVRMRTMWWKLGEYGKRQSPKQAVGAFYETCSAIVKRCDALCKE